MAKGKGGANRPPPRVHQNETVGPHQQEEREVYIEQRSIAWSAPMPPPEIVRGYNDIIENGAERLFKQFETEADHRRQMQWRGQTFALVAALSGRVCALIVSLAFLGVAVYALSIKEPWVAAAFGGGSLALVVGAFTGLQNAFRRVQQQHKSTQDK